MSTNVHTFQLAAVLIEAAEDEGQKSFSELRICSLMQLNGSKRS